MDNVVQRIEDSVVNELEGMLSDGIAGTENISLAEALSIINDKTGKRFVVIIDEWDVLIRDQSKDTKLQKDYIDFLRTLFKGSHPTEFLHLAYL